MKTKGKMVLVAVTSLLISFAACATTYAMAQFLDHPAMEGFAMLALSMAAAALLVPVRAYLMQSGCVQLTRDHRAKMLGSAVKKRMLYAESPDYEDRVSRLWDSSLQDQKLFGALSAIAAAAGSALAFCGLLFWQLSALALVSLMIAALLAGAAFWVNYRTARLMYGFWQKYMENTRRFQYLSDVLTKKEFVEEKKIFGYRPFFTELFGQEFDRAAAKNRELGKQRAALELSNDLIYALFVFAEFAFLIWCYDTGRVTLGFVVSVIPFGVAAFASVCAAFSAAGDLVRIRKFCQDAEDFAAREQESGSARFGDTGDGSAVCLSHVSFTYPGQEYPVIQDLSLTLEKGKKYALVGANGSGKTTLTKLIGGFYEPQAGEVRCMDRPAILFQDFNRYPFSVAENIALEAEFSEADITEKLGQVGLREKIHALPEKEKTQLTRMKQEGAGLSGGEWQRIALARILHSKSDIVILDEPTASLDPFIEVEIYNSYMKLLKERTVIFITHRLGYLRDVDEILVLGGGRILERGSHEALMGNEDSLYRRMYQEQRRVYQDEK